MYYGYFFDLRYYFFFLSCVAFSILMLSSIQSKEFKQVGTNNFMMSEAFINSMVTKTKEFNKSNLEDVGFQ